MKQKIKLSYTYDLEQDENPEDHWVLWFGHAKTETPMIGHVVKGHKSASRVMNVIAEKILKRNLVFTEGMMRKFARKSIKHWEDLN